MRSVRRFSLEELAPYLLEIPDPPALLYWPAVFGNEQPVELEVGFGKGLFLVTACHSNPGTNFLGVEIARKYQLFTAGRLAKRGLRNVRLVKADARLFLRDCIAVSSCQAVHVYFPDPWWKKRHLKRRVFTAEFAAESERILLPGGRLHIATDVLEYFQIMTQLVTQETKLRPLPPLEPLPPAHDLDYLTNFERKFRREGRSIYRQVYEKSAGAEVSP